MTTFETPIRGKSQVEKSSAQLGLRPFMAWIGIFGLLVLNSVCSWDALAQMTGEGLSSPTPKLLSSSAEATAEPIFHLTYEVGMIGRPDSGPSIEVFNNRKVRVCRPAYMKNPGCREMILAEEEFDALLATFADQEILTLDDQKLKSEMARGLQEMGIMTKPGTHGSKKTISITNLDFVPAGESAPTMRNITKSITAEDLTFHAERLTGASEIQKLAKGIEQLETLARHPELKKVP